MTEEIKHYITTEETKIKPLTNDPLTAVGEMVESLRANIKHGDRAENSLFMASINSAQVMQPRINTRGNNDKSIPASKDIAKVIRETLKENLGDMEIDENKSLYERLTRNVNLQARVTALLLSGKVWVGHYSKTDKARQSLEIAFDERKHVQTIFGSNCYPFNAMSIGGVDQPKADMEIVMTTSTLNNTYDAYFGGKPLADIFIKVGGERKKFQKEWEKTSRNTLEGAKKVLSLIQDIQKYWDTKIILKDSYTSFNPKSVTYGDLKADEQPFGEDAYILDETKNKAVQRPISSDIAVAIKTHALDILKRVEKLEAELETERQVLESNAENTKLKLPLLSDGRERNQTIADVQAVRKIVQDNRKKKTA